MTDLTSTENTTTEAGLPLPGDHVDGGTVIAAAPSGENNKGTVVLLLVPGPGMNYLVIELSDRRDQASVISRFGFANFLSAVADYREQAEAWAAVLAAIADRVA